MKSPFFRLTYAAVLAVFVIQAALAADWTRFRGPNGSGVSEETGIPTTFSDTKNLKWKVELPGAGASSAVITGDNVIVTCYSGYGVGRGGGGSPEDLRRHVVVVNRKTGKIRWQKAVKPVLPEDSARGNITSHGFASSTPATDGERIYVFFGKTGLLCYDMDGKELWRQSLGTGSAIRGWGSGASPILYKNTVIMNASAEDYAVVALDKKTGKQVWKQQVDGFTGSWCTPLITKSIDGKRDELVINVPYEIWALNPDTGKLLWYCDGISSGTMCPSLVAHKGIIYATGGRRAETLAIKTGGKGNVTKSHTLWRSQAGSYVTSPVFYKGNLYIVSDRGISYCIDGKNGKTLTRKRLSSGRRLYASPTIIDGKIYAVTQNGTVHVISADSKLETLASNRFRADSSSFNGSPAVAGNELFLRSNKFLYCISAADATKNSR